MKGKDFKVFKISWPDKFGPEWLCRANLLGLLFTEERTRPSLVKVEDITECSLKELMEGHLNGKTERTETRKELLQEVE